MPSEIIYMLSIVAAGFAVNYVLRSLPFVLFAGRDRKLPGWVESFGKWASPVIITCLVMYSYAGLEWRTPGPFVAGAITVGLQLWRRNPLVSIIAGTAMYMLMLNCGCVSVKKVNLEARNPSISVHTTGIYVDGERVEIRDVPKLLDDADIPKTETVHIFLEPDVRDLTEARTLMGFLATKGYTRPILITKRHAESRTKGRALQGGF